MRKTFLLVFYGLLLAPALFGRAPLHVDATFTPITPTADIVAPSLAKEVVEAPSQKKSIRFFTPPKFIVKILTPKAARSARRSAPRALPEAKTQEDYKLPKIKANPHEKRTHFMRKIIEETTKHVERKRDNLKIRIRRTELSDDELYHYFKTGKFLTSGSATGVTTSECLYCEDCVIKIVQEKGAAPEIFDVSDEFAYEPDTQQDLYNLAVHRTTDTDEELLLDCQTPAPITETIWVPGEKTWYGKQKYTAQDGEQIQFDAINFPGKIFLRDGQFLTIAVDDEGFCYVKPLGAHEIFAMGYTIVYR